VIDGVNHIAVMTEDLDRFVEFYSDVFDLELVFSEDTPAFRHAILRTGPNSWIHPAEVVDRNPRNAASTSMIDRGHLDHLALTASDVESFAVARKRLVARGASDGSVDDLGAFHSAWFTDPDGMQVELVLIVDDALRVIHAPEPLERA
jgi:catechol 2,3-dioxygenase-like lactoylglutathione lyase family enzyme